MISISLKAHASVTQTSRRRKGTIGHPLNVVKGKKPGAAAPGTKSAPPASKASPPASKGGAASPAKQATKGTKTR